MSHSEAIKVITLSFTLLGLWALWVFCWKEYSLDKLRQDLFGIRDELFDLAADRAGSSLSFDSVAYNTFRNQLNATIRFAHKITMTRVVVFYCLRPFLSPGMSARHFMNQRKSLILSIEEPEIRREVELLVRRLNRSIFWMLMKTSPVFLMLFGLVLIRVITLALMQCFSQSLRVILETENWKKTKAVFAAIWLESDEGDMSMFNPVGKRQFA